ncbi:MAG: transposase [Bacteroidetes bacterium]|nr:transposase [Bacteroidota bacterium]MBT5426896.1 transposase [Bacteroidota bacterium]
MKFEPDLIQYLLECHQNGANVSKLCEAYEIGESTFYDWQKKFHGMKADQISRMIDLESENRKLKGDLKKSTKLLTGAKAIIKKKH